MQFILGFLTLALMIFCLVDIIRRDNSLVRYLPKPVWLILVILLPFIGSVLWLLLGREWSSSDVPPRMRKPADTPKPATASYQHPPTPHAPSTEEQMAALELEIEQDRLRAEIAKRKAELKHGDEAPDAAARP